MKKIILTALGMATAFAIVLFAVRVFADEPAMLQQYEFVTIRWGGKENTCLIRSNGKVQMLGSVLNRTSKPDRVDERSFYMNIAMNAVAKEGYEFAGMTNDEIVMKRSLAR